MVADTWTSIAIILSTQLFRHVTFYLGKEGLVEARSLFMPIRMWIIGLQSMQELYHPEGDSQEVRALLAALMALLQKVTDVFFTIMVVVN